MIKPCLSALLGLMLLHSAPGQERGVINDPDGFTNLRAGQGADSAVVAKVKVGEVFEFESGEGSEWWKVSLASGKSGWMHFSRIRFHHTLAEIPERDEEGSEVGYLGKSHGFDYCATARSAAKGVPAAMKRYFGINDADGGAGEMHSLYFNRVIHLLGDEKLAAFLKDQPLAYRLDVRYELTGGMALWPFESNRYTERVFPRTYALLCRKEIVDWPSPDGRFAIRKVFDDARVTENSKVVKAELIEKVTGEGLADLTGDDIGTGFDREGDVMWAPDSNRFAYFSGAKLGGEAQTVVFQKTGAKFSRMELQEAQLPGRAKHAELKGADVIWRFVKPLSWEKPDVLVLLHHEYFEGKHGDRSIRSVGRTYDITHDLTKGTATAKAR
jgi:hypothetical protein